MNHWMSQGGVQTVTGTRELQIEDIADIRFTQTNPGRFFSGSDTFDAVRYGNDVYRLSFDLKTGQWVGDCILEKPSQGSVFVNYVKQAHAALLADGFHVAQS